MTINPRPEDTIAGTLVDLLEGRRTAIEVVEANLARIDERDADVRAWVVVDRANALERARALDADRAAGRPLGWLHGVTIGVKDIINVTCLPTAAGFGPWKDRAAQEDASIVARLRAAGAIILGKTATTPFAWVDPPPTRNPWDLSRTPGGSSSGSAAAVADGMCLAALGSQTGGSITRPASYCGVCGLKPTYGALNLEGIIPLAPSLDHPGPIARSCTDLALLWSVLSDTRMSEARTQRPRLGRVRGLFDERAEPVMCDAFETALQQLEAAGASIVEPPMPAAFDDVSPRFRTVLAREVAEYHRSLFATHGADYPPRLRALVEEGLDVSEDDYQSARRYQSALRAAMTAPFDQADVLVTPATTGTAPELSTTGDPVFNAPWSYCGLPTVSLPIGLAPDGLPLAIQLVGPPRGDTSLLAIAQWCEDRLREARAQQKDQPS
jgi:aspartyl-tRNA(Asn)/glutamyl-tRNA(Gln) amidotransferase subunit A